MTVTLALRKPGGRKTTNLGITWSTPRAPGQPKRQTKKREQESKQELSSLKWRGRDGNCVLVAMEMGMRVGWGLAVAEAGEEQEAWELAPWQRGFLLGTETAAGLPGGGGDGKGDRHCLRLCSP